MSSSAACSIQCGRGFLLSLLHFRSDSQAHTPGRPPRMAHCLEGKGRGHHRGRSWESTSLSAWPEPGLAAVWGGRQWIEDRCLSLSLFLCNYVFQITRIMSNSKNVSFLKCNNALKGYNTMSLLITVLSKNSLNYQCYEHAINFIVIILIMYLISIKQ